MNIADYCFELNRRLELSAPEERIALACTLLGKAFKVSTDEVALFRYDEQREELSFIWPENLKTSGTIPLNANNSMVARTLRENKVYGDNRFSKSAHGVIFEAFSGRQPIQKIISAPMEERGVVQISRKGVDSMDAGPDFSQAEMNALQKIAKVIAKYI